MGWIECTACSGWQEIGEDAPEDHGWTKDGNGYLCPRHEDDDDE